MSPSRVLHIEKEKRNPLITHQIAQERGTALSTETHVTDPELELDPYIIMDYVDGDERRNVRFGDVWLPYRRVESYVLLVLTPSQDDTSRVPSEASANFDMRTLRDDDLVRINYRFYTGFDLKRVIADDLDGSETLLGSEAIMPHGCPEPFRVPELATDEAETAKKLPFWESNQSLPAFLVALTGGLGSLLMMLITVGDYIQSTYLGYRPAAVGMAVEVGILCLSWLITEYLAAKRSASLGESTLVSWKLTAVCCCAGVLNIALMLYAIAKQG